MKMTWFFVVIFLLIPGPRLVLASDSFEFVSGVIRSFEIPKIAKVRREERKGEGFVSLMRDIRVFANEMRQANSTIEKYVKSQNNLIKESAQKFSIAYLSIAVNMEEVLAFLEETLNKPGEAASKQGTWQRKLADYHAREDELWRVVPLVTAMATYALVDPTRTEEGKLRFLTITKAEQDSLKSDLRRMFGDKITGGIKGGMFAIDASARLLWEFLSKPWKPSDVN